MFTTIYSETLTTEVSNTRHFLRDNSGVTPPQVRVTGVYAYFPIYSPKGEEGEIRQFAGPDVLKQLEDKYGKPDVIKYGLPYTAATLHAKLGGALVVQSIKAPNATFPSVIVNMKISKSQDTKVLGYAITTPENKDNVIKVDNKTIKAPALWYFQRKNKEAYEESKLPVFPGSFIESSIKLGAVALDDADLVIPEVNAPSNYFAEIFKIVLGKDNWNQYVNLSKMVKDNEEAVKALLNGHPGVTTTDKAETMFKEFTKNIAEFLKLFKPVEIKPLQVDFEQADIRKMLAKHKMVAEEIKQWGGIVSEDMLEMLVSKLNRKAYDDITAYLGQPSEEIKESITVPILWGMSTSKGAVDNKYKITFNTTTGLVGGRPLIDMSIRDSITNELLPESRKTVSFTNDFVNNVPVLIDSVYTKFNGFDGGFKFRTAGNRVMNDIGEFIHTYLKTIFKITDDSPSAKLAGTHADTLGTIGENFIDRINEEIALFDEPEDSTMHRLSYVDFTKFASKVGFMYSPGLTDYNFSGGDNGEFEFMKEFDWDFNFEDERLVKRYGEKNELFKFYRKLHGDKKIVQEIFVDAITGKTNANVITLDSNKAYYMVDCGYPLSVQTAMHILGNRKHDMQVILNTPNSVRTVDSAKAYAEGSGIVGLNRFWYTGNWEWVDPQSNKSVRVPTTFCMIPNILRHYVNGFSEPMAGISEAAIRLPLPGSGRGFGNTSIEENEKLLKAKVNYFSVYGDSTYYVDSQIGNYGDGKISSLRYFHNTSILNMMIRDLYHLTQPFKHKPSNQATVDRIQEECNNVLNKYRTKVDDLQCVAEFRDSYDKAIGHVTIKLQVRFFGEILYFFIDINALPVKL